MRFLTTFLSLAWSSFAGTCSASIVVNVNVLHVTWDRMLFALFNFLSSSMSMSMCLLYAFEIPRGRITCFGKWMFVSTAECGISVRQMWTLCENVATRTFVNVRPKSFKRCLCRTLATHCVLSCSFYHHRICKFYTSFWVLCTMKGGLWNWTFWPLPTMKSLYC